MVDVTTQIVINLPVEKVAMYASNPDNAPLWYKNIKTVEWKSQPPVQPGSYISFTAQFLGKKITYTYKVTEFIADKLFVMQSTLSSFPMQTTYSWENINEVTTKMTLRNKGRPTGFSRLFTPIMSMMIRKANNKDLQTLKHILESNPNHHDK